MLRSKRSTARTRGALAALLLIGVVASACGSADKKAADPDATTKSSSAEPAATDGGGGGDGDRITIRWFVGLGTGSQAEQIEREQAVIDTFNSSQDKIKLEAEFVDNNTAKDALAAEIAGGNPPDIIGPVGREGANAFSGQYLNLDPLIEKSKIDLSKYEPEQLEARRAPDGTIDSLPFASYPQALFYNTELFDEAGLPYPPAEYGAVYGEGTEYEGEWNIDKMTEIAKILTVDANGNDATSPDFDKTKVAQWGFVHQWTAPPRAQGTFFGAGNIIGDDGKAKVPAQWLEEWKWYHSLIHELGVAPTQADLDGDVLSGNAFNSGKVAMADTHLWYTCCLNDGAATPVFKTFWNAGALPDYEGTVTSKLHADTFRIHKDTKNQDAAFEVLRYFQEDAALDLLSIYGAMPARTDLRDAYFANLDKNYTQGVNWQIFLDGLAFPDNPSHELDMPSFVESDQRIKELEPLINGDPNLDLDAEAKKMESDLDAIWAAAG